MSLDFITHPQTRPQDRFTITLGGSIKQIDAAALIRAIVVGANRLKSSELRAHYNRELTPLSDGNWLFV
jgi:hypothetical protein